MSATVTIPEGITVIVDDNSRHDLAPGTYPIHATTIAGEPVPAGDRPHFLEVDLPVRPGPGIVRFRIFAYQDHFTADTDTGSIRIPIGSNVLERLNHTFGDQAMARSPQAQAIDLTGPGAAPLRRPQQPSTLRPQGHREADRMATRRHTATCADCLAAIATTETPPDLAG